MAPVADPDPANQLKTTPARSLRAATRFVVPPVQPRRGFESLAEAQEFERNVDEKAEMARIDPMKGAACDAAFDTTLL